MRDEQAWLKPVMAGLLTFRRVGSSFICKYKTEWTASREKEGFLLAISDACSIGFQQYFGVREFHINIIPVVRIKRIKIQITEKSFRDVIFHY